MELTGKIIELLPEQSGESSRGQWRKQQYILETEGQYPKKVCFMAWGDKIDEFTLKVGETVTVGINLESREYNGRWYTDVKAWKVTRGEASQNQNQEQNSAPPQSQVAQQIAQNFDDDIPF